MRQNLPITQREYPFPPNRTLVSVTDLKGRITYCNPAFIEVSGYSREELLGQPHNIVRHPDMPEEAYRDMWATIASGRPWSAPVKNRRKNGDHYWVLANATPVMHNGQVTGYMSVRTKPTREQIEQAQTLYTRMRDEAQAGQPSLALHHGHPVRTGWRGHLQRWLRPTLGKKLGAIAVALSFVVQFIESTTEGMAEGWHIAAWCVTAALAISPELEKTKRDWEAARAQAVMFPGCPEGLPETPDDDREAIEAAQLRITAAQEAEAEAQVAAAAATLNVPPVAPPVTPPPATP